MALEFLSTSCRAYPTYEHDPMKHSSMPKDGARKQTSSADLTCCDLCAMSMPYLHISHLASGNIRLFPIMSAMNLFQKPRSFVDDTAYPDLNTTRSWLYYQRVGPLSLALRADILMAAPLTSSTMTKLVQ